MRKRILTRLLQSSLLLPVQLYLLTGACMACWVCLSMFTSDGSILDSNNSQQKKRNRELVAEFQFLGREMTIAFSVFGSTTAIAIYFTHVTSCCVDKITIYFCMFLDAQRGFRSFFSGYRIQEAAMLRSLLGSNYVYLSLQNSVKLLSLPRLPDFATKLGNFISCSYLVK